MIIYFFVTLQTDDKGVFCSDLSQEYQLAASTFGLSRDAVWKLSQQAIDCIFAPDGVKQQLRQKWADMKPQVLQWLVQGILKLIKYLSFLYLGKEKFLQAFVMLISI